MYKNQILLKDPKIVAVGGGTGLSTLLRGLKRFTTNITAVVTVADDGGGSGQIRQDLGILPPGDIRNCILALANVEPIMEKLMQYRFKEGVLKNQSFGNLLIAAMTDISNGFEEAIKQISNVLAVTGKVLPVSLEDIKLGARLQNGMVVYGESNIPYVQMETGSKIEEVFLTPARCAALPEVLNAMSKADAIILGPGSLYTSIIPNLLVEDVAEAIRNSRAKKIYVSNVMTQPGETINYTVYDHINGIIKHSGHGLIDLVIVNNRTIPDRILYNYTLEGAAQVVLDRKPVEMLGIEIREGDLINLSGDLVRHDGYALAQEIIDTLIIDL